MGLDRPVLRATEGLLFWRLMGTGRGSSMTLGADLRRWALLAVWRDERHLERFLRCSPIAARWRGEAEECWQARLLPLASRGRWGGTQPFGTQPFGPARNPFPILDSGPVAVLTRASIRPGRLVAFYRSVAPVQNALLRQKGCLASVGMGEWPLARQATFSLWRDNAAISEFAHRGHEHRRVIRESRSSRWYSEELFARFTPYGSEGAWDGADPLG